MHHTRYSKYVRQKIVYVNICVSFILTKRKSSREPLTLVNDISNDWCTVNLCSRCTFWCTTRVLTILTYVRTHQKCYTEAQSNNNGDTEINDNVDFENNDNIFVTGAFENSDGGYV